MTFPLSRRAIFPATFGFVAAFAVAPALAEDRGLPGKPFTVGQIKNPSIISSVIDYQGDGVSIEERNALWAEYMSADKANLEAPEGKKGSTLAAYQAAYQALQAAEISIIQAYEDDLTQASKGSTVIVAFYSEQHPLDMNVLARALGEHDKLGPYKVVKVDADQYFPIYASYYPNTPYSDITFEGPEVSVVHDGIFHNGISDGASFEALETFFSKGLDPTFWEEEAFHGLSYRFFA